MIGDIYLQEYQIMNILQNTESITWHGKIFNKDWRTEVTLKMDSKGPPPSKEKI